MRLICYTELENALSPTDMGRKLNEHLQTIANPARRRDSHCVWGLLALALRESGIAFGTVEFLPSGKPVFANRRVEFSLSHGGALCAVALSDAPVGVDVEPASRLLSPALSVRLRTPMERAANISDIALWCAKEALVKRDGRGWDVRPDQVDTTTEAEWFCQTVADSSGNAHMLAAAFSNKTEPIRWAHWNGRTKQWESSL